MSSASSPMPPILALPNELLLCILSYSPTIDLLPLVPTSHRFASLICLLIRSRMHNLSISTEHKILLELYPPSAGQSSEPPLSCAPLGTPGLDDTLWQCDTQDEQCVEGQSPSIKEKPYNEQLASMRRLYSRFRPRKEVRSRGTPAPRHPAGDVPGSRTHPSSAVRTERYAAKGEEERLVSKVLDLDSHELFTQLCANVHLVKRSGWYASFVKIEDGFMRLFRKWFADTCRSRSYGGGSSDEREFKRGREGAETSLESDNSISWLSLSKNIGFRFGVQEKAIHNDRMVILLPGEDPPVSYEVEYGELIVRTSMLLLVVERSIGEAQGRTIVMEQMA